ncbi:MAG: RraA family protein [Hyphomicrobiales bacterium]
MNDISALTEQLYTAVLSDVLDELGFMGQAMRSFIRPSDESLVMMGRVRTGLYMETFSVKEGENPYELEMRLIDDLQPGEIAVLGCNGPTERIAPWGELLSTAARARGAAGCVTDGLVRDLRHIRNMRFPVFHGGIGPLDSKGRAKMVEIDTAIECGGIRMRTGDLIFGDVDGVIVIPQDVAAEAIERARTKVTSENHTRDALRAGGYLRDVFAQYGVL